MLSNDNLLKHKREKRLKSEKRQTQRTRTEEKRTQAKVGYQMITCYQMTAFEKE